MSFKRRMERGSCKYKIRYESEQAAWIAVRVLPMNKGYRGKPYLCQWCKTWHVGRVSKERKKMLRGRA